MPRLRWTRDSTFHDTASGFRAVGPGIYDVPEERVEEYLAHRSGAWERVDSVDDGDIDETEDDDGADDASEDDDTGGGSNQEDVDKFDADEWLNQHWKTRESAVLDGDVDSHLDAIVDVETSENVAQAAKDRLADLKE